MQNAEVARVLSGTQQVFVGFELGDFDPELLESQSVSLDQTGILEMALVTSKHLKEANLQDLKPDVYWSMKILM